MKRLKLTLLSSLAVISMMAQAPAGYYDLLEGKYKGSLKQAAKSIVKKHTAISYGESGTWQAFRETDVRVVNGKEIWWDMYSDNQVAVSSGHDGLNIEHSVANSWWGKTKNDAYKDLFHLNPSNKDANSRKSNYPLGEIVVDNKTWTNGVTTVGHPKSGQGGGNDWVYEPADCYKGDFARVFFYMFTVYDDISWQSTTDWMYDTRSELTLKPWAYELLLKWAKEDPVDQKEIDRNNAIYKIQGNRNPYIDLPELCEYIWGAKNNTPYHYDGSGEPITPPGPTEPTEPIEPGTDGILLQADFEKDNISAYVTDGWGNLALSGSLSGWFLKEFEGNTYASASSFKESGNGPFEYWLVTPALDLKGGEASLSFRTQGAYGCDGSSLSVYLMDAPDPRDAHLTELDATICTPQPNGAKPVYSDWAESGTVDMGSGLGTVYVGFRYLSETGGSDGSATYCLDDVIIKGTPGDEGEEPGPGEGIGVISGDNQPTQVFDLTGRRVSDGSLSGLPSGIYIVVTPTSHTKVAVR